MIATGVEPTARPDATLIRALRAAHAMVGRDDAGQPVLYVAPDTPWLTFLAPDLQRAILAGNQPPYLTLARLMDGSLPLLWSEQARQIGVAPAV